MTAIEITGASKTLPAVTLTASATATSSADHTTGGATATCSSYGVTIIEILRDGQPLGGNRARALPGEKINLSVSGADGNTTYSWASPANHFKEYAPSAIQALAPTALTGADLTSSTLHFYWKSGDNTDKSVTCTVTVAGQSVAVEGVITVYKPTATLLGVPGSVVAESLTVVLKDPTNPVQHGHGFSWEGTTVSLPFGEGKFAIVQTGNVLRQGGDGRTQMGALVGDFRLPASASSGLDGGFPYLGNEYDAKSVAPFYIIPPRLEGGGDTPQESLTAWCLVPPSGTRTPLNFDTIAVSDSYTTWLMFKPSGADSRWVPLKYFDWSWQASAVRVEQPTLHAELVGTQTPPSPAPPFIVPPYSPLIFVGVDTSTFPTWNSAINAQANWVPTGN